MQFNYRLPAEWETQSGTQLTWPTAMRWADSMANIEQVFIQVATEISARQLVVIAANDDAHREHIQTKLKSANTKNIRIYVAPSEDIWVRDHGPLTVIQNQKPVLLDFIFNGWGDKYDAQLDNQVTRKLYSQAAYTPQTLIHSVDMVLEGGGIEADGAGTLLTTSHCLLANNRNPGLTCDQISTRLKNLFGVEKILWLDHGQLAGDDTDGHIDTIARFVDANTILYMACDDKEDHHYSDFAALEQQLQTFTNASNQSYDCIALPFPKPRFAQYDSRRLPLTYANFLFLNGAILMPTYADVADDTAINILQNACPQQEIIPINCNAVVEWYGSLHCMSMQLPIGALT